MYLVNKYFVGILNSAIAHEKHKIKCPLNENDFTVIVEDLY